MNQVGRRLAAAIADGLFQRIEHEVGAQGRRDSPAHNPAGEDIDDEPRVDEAAPSRYVRKVRDPELIRARGGELPVDEIRRPRGFQIGLRGGLPGAAAHRPRQAHRLHQPPHRAAGDLDAFAPQLPPHFPRPVHLMVFVPDPHAPLPRCCLRRPCASRPPMRSRSTPVRRCS